MDKGTDMDMETKHTENKLRVGIIGATGYAGAELFRLLSAHRYVTIAAVSSTSFEGQALEAVYPALSTGEPHMLCDMDGVVAESDVIFAALPHGLSEELAVKCDAAGKVLIDLGADFRLVDEGDYTKWYGLPFKHPELHQKSLYCLPEINREKIPAIDIIANPGCYPTSIALGLMPALKGHFVNPVGGIIIDSKSGVTGAGRGLTQNTHYPDTNEAFSAYKAACHRHTPEIEQTLSALYGDKVNVTFVPHLLPVNRGILSTIYVKTDKSLDELHAAYTAFYAGEKFVRVMPLGSFANIKNVRMSNYCDISLHLDKHTSTLIITSAIDNMVKGAAGQAIQNMNIRFGFPEDEAISMLAPSF